MNDYPNLRGKRILVVDDEPDVLEVVEENLPYSQVITASDYAAASNLIATQTFDLAILDIMGVNGFALLQECAEKKIPAAMLTAHSVNPESLKKALELGAVSFVPKEAMHSLADLMEEILEGVSAGRSHWKRLFQRLGPFFKKRLGLTWEDLEKPPSPPYMY